MQSSQTAPGAARNTMNVEARHAKINDNMQQTKNLHNNKTMRSDANFKQARVTSCSGVLMKNGHAVCLAFDNPNPKPVNIAAMKSAETTSLAA